MILNRSTLQPLVHERGLSLSHVSAQPVNVFKPSMITKPQLVKVLEDHRITLELPKAIMTTRTKLEWPSNSIECVQRIKQTFTYEPLPDDNSWIRLLEIEGDARSWHTSPLRCTVSTVRLAEAPNYGAISYRWGEPPTSDYSAPTLWTGDQFLYIWPNCHFALCQVRLHLEMLAGLGINHIWIDSICINQTDLEEKAAQVRMMASHIFPGADVVFISLGHEFDGSGKLITMLNQMDHKGETLPEERQLDIETLDALHSLSYRPYWTRLWILPEIITAKSVQIFCGPDVIRWRLLSKFIYKTKKQTPLRNLDITAKFFDRRINPGQLYVILGMCAQLECADPRDRVYAFWSMITWPKDRIAPKIDYRIASLQLAQDVLQLILRDHEPVYLHRAFDAIFQALMAFDVCTDDIHLGAAHDMQAHREREHSTEVFASDSYGLRESHVVVKIDHSDPYTIIRDEHGRMSLDKGERVNARTSSFNATETGNDQANCQALFQGSHAIGYLCPAASVGDIVLFAIYSPKDEPLRCLVVRPYNDYGSRLFKIVGIATIAREVKPRHSGGFRTGKDENVYVNLDASDLTTLAAFTLLSRKAKSAEARTEIYRLQSGTIWPKKAIFAWIHINRRGDEKD